MVLEVHRDGRLLGRWSLDEGPVEMRLSERGGRTVASFTARAGEPPAPEQPEEPPEDLSEDTLLEDTLPDDPQPPAASPSEPVLPSGVLDEAPLPSLEREVGDDLTMPLPEVTESEPSTSLPEPETDEAPPRSRARPGVPNLAKLGARPAKSPRPAGRTKAPVQRRRSAPKMQPVLSPALDELGPVDEETFHDDQFDLDGLLEDEREVSRTAPSGLTQALESQPEPTVGGDLVPEIVARPAEVWIRSSNSWRSAGQLLPGRKATSRGGWVQLEDGGGLLVSCGPELAGTATLMDGQSFDLDGTHGERRLPPGASVILRAGAYGLYVRSEPLDTDAGRGSR
jgi:hypothetical protein